MTPRKDGDILNLNTYHMNLDPIQQHHIENYGLNSAGGSIGARPLAEERHKEYMAHLERMKWDDD